MKGGRETMDREEREMMEGKGRKGERGRREWWKRREDKRGRGEGKMQVGRQ